MVAGFWHLADGRRACAGGGKEKPALHRPALQIVATIARFVARRWPAVAPRATVGVSPGATLMNLRISGAIAALCLSSVASAGTVHVEDGDLAGATARGIESFKGVPFAAPPVGKLRWHAPQAPVAWPGVREATRYGPACMQGGDAWPLGTPTQAQSEDCLSLNVWRPAGVAPDAHLAVMVWIPGGGWTDGSGSAPLYDGSQLARRGVIVVTLNYRVGAFGFLAHPALSQESAQASSGNYGLLDQIAALAWVQRNIAAFGGDASRVTIFGQSAGSMSANLLTVSPLARGLFQRVIGQSGAVFIPPEMAGADTFLLPGAQAQGERFATDLGASTLAQLREVPAAAIVKAQRGYGFHFILDKAVLPEEPWAAYSAGHQAPADMLIGWNADEGRMFIAGQTVTAATLESGISQEIGQFPAALRPWYPARTDAQARAARAAFEGDLRMGYDTWTWMRLQAATGHGHVYAYRFDQAPPYPAASPLADFGTTHGAEMHYMFDALDQAPWAWRPADRRLATAMAGYWTNFAKTGNPNGPGLPRWPAYVGARPGAPAQVMHLGTPLRARAQAGLGPLEAMDAMYQALRRQRPAPLIDR
jgi:para-nitrobenzyl esterase